MTHRKKTILAVVASLVVAGGGAYLFSTGFGVAPDIARGATLYAENCASCHGANLEGQPNWRIAGADGVLPAPPHDETGHTWHHGDGLLFSYTKQGGQAAMAELGVTSFTSGMPAFGGILSDDDLRAVLAYIRSTWSEKAQQSQATRTGLEQMDEG